MLITDTAICIRAIDYSETSQIVSVFCRCTGKVRAIAKGSKRPRSAFDGPIDVLSLGDAVFSHKEDRELDILTEFQCRGNGPAVRAVRRGIYALNCCLFAAELIDCLTADRDPHPDLFENFLNLLQEIPAADNDTEATAMVAAFELSLLRQLGFDLRLRICANCGMSTLEATRRLYFSSSANGLLCRDCQGSFPDRIAMGKTASDILIQPASAAGADATVVLEAVGILTGHLQNLAGRRFKMARYVLQSRVSPEC